MSKSFHKQREDKNKFHKVEKHKNKTYYLDNDDYVTFIRIKRNKKKRHE